MSGRDEEPLVGADIAGLLQSHIERLRASAASTDASGFEPAGILRSLNERGSETRTVLLSRGYSARSDDPELDRFTLKGAFALARRSINMARAKPPKVAAIRVPRSLEDALRLRKLADMNSLRRVAQHPIRAPGSNRPLWVMMAATAALSFVGMSVVWSPLTAVIILAVIAFHEAGHAVAMRVAGYRDVNIFFVPFVGALTLGRDSGSSVRQRLIVMLAGPVPGLWLAVIVLILQHHVGSVPALRALAFALLFINALNLLPITPLDGGRALELLTPPASTLRLVIQGLSGLGLLGLGAYLDDAILLLLGLWWLFLLRRQLTLWRLRRRVDSLLGDRPGESDVVTAVCTALGVPPYASWRAAARFATARLFIQQSGQVAPTTADRVMAVSLYAFAWLPAAVALLIWNGHLAV
jgi:Zn-dependent protease